MASTTKIGRAAPKGARRAAKPVAEPVAEPTVAVDPAPPGGQPDPLAAARDCPAMADAEAALREIRATEARADGLLADNRERWRLVGAGYQALYRAVAGNKERPAPKLLGAAVRLYPEYAALAAPVRSDLAWLMRRDDTLGEGDPREEASGLTFYDASEAVGITTSHPTAIRTAWRAHLKAVAAEKAEREAARIANDPKLRAAKEAAERAEAERKAAVAERERAHMAAITAAEAAEVVAAIDRMGAASFVPLLLLAVPAGDVRDMLRVLSEPDPEAELEAEAAAT